MSEDSLYHIDSRIVEVLEKHTDHETGEVAEEALAELDALYEKREAKLLAYGHVILWKRLQAERLIAQAKAFEAEGKRLRDRARRYTNLADRLLARAEGAMSPGEKLADDTAEFSWRQSTRVVVAEGAKVEEWPAVYRKSEPRLSAIKSAAKAGDPIPPEVTIDTRKRLSVK